jgi:iron complex transport system substrate-binding protein
MVERLHRSERGTVSRREFLLGSLAMSSLLVACGGQEGGESSTGSSVTPSAVGPWTFVDDRGVEASAPQTPTRIVAGADAAGALWDFGIHPMGIFAPAKFEKVHQLDHVDLSTVERLGEVFEEINVEKLAALDPELLVAIYYAEAGGDPLIYGIKNYAQQDVIETIVPSAAINASVTSDVAIERFSDLAASLGVDLDDPMIAAERTRFEEAAGALTKLSTDKPLSVLVAYPAIDQLYVLRPSSLADMAYITKLGVNLTDPDGDDPWVEALSWEDADKYAADVIVIDATALQHGNEGFVDLPTWQQLPAVKAGQTTSWVTPAPFSYRATADVLEALQAALEQAQPLS